MKLSHLLDHNCILCNAQATTLDEAQKLLIDLYTRVTGKSGEPVKQALAERYASIGDMVLAPGIAFPHIREDFLDKFNIFIGLFPNGVSLGEGRAPLKIIVFYCVPSGKSNLYLRCLAAMSRLLSNSMAITELTMQGDSGAVINYVAQHDEVVNEFVSARDLMRTDFPFVSYMATLRETIRLMIMSKVCDIPVVDDPENMRYMGLVTTGRLLKVGIPDYLLMMDNLNFLQDFEPFQDLLRNEQSMLVENILKHNAPIFEATTPMFQVAIRLVETHTEFGVVLERGRLIGTISRFDFIHKVVRV